MESHGGGASSAFPVISMENTDGGLRDANLDFEKNHEADAKPRNINLSQGVARGLRLALKKARVPTAAPSTPCFVPFSQIVAILTPENIRKLLNELNSSKRMKKTHKKDRVSKICSITTDSPYCCRRLVATLIAEEREEDILTVVERGLRDDCVVNMGLPEKKAPPGTRWSAKASALFETLDIDDHNEQAKILLHETAKSFTAPYFTRPEHGVYHYVFDLTTVLPFLTQDEPNSRSGQTDDAHPTLGGQGGYGSVRRTLLHPDHCAFSDYGTSHHRGYVAIKELDRCRDIRVDKAFEEEATALLPFSRKNDKQLVKLLATYEIKTGDTRKFYLIFPWAETSVESLWKSHPNGDGRELTGYNLRWISGQAVAIADALTYIHEEYAENLPADLKKNDEVEKWGRHGDIKAANFLVYTKSQDSKDELIFLADFGISRFSRQESRSMRPPKAASPSYRPPEFDTGRLSRKSDIWSLGAFFLEFLTWYLCGWEEVNSEFPDKRETRDHNGVYSDIFFVIETNKDNVQTVKVKEQVHWWIRHLRGQEQATQFVHDVLDLVQHRMLVIKPVDRISAIDLKRELLEINKRFEGDGNYLMPCPYTPV